MTWIYLSPHFDDAAYSCGGAIWEQSQRGERVEIWTICAGEPPAGFTSPFVEAIHARWGTGAEPVPARRAEDAAACRILGASQRLFDLPDCIYRSLPNGEPLITRDEDLFAPLPEAEAPLVERLAAWLDRNLPPGAQLISPLTLGGHMDHRLARSAAERLGRSLHYYADVPYVLTEKIDWAQVIQPGWVKERIPVSREGLAAWQEAARVYASQSSSFWSDDGAMRDQFEAYWKEHKESVRLFRGSNP